MTLTNYELIKRIYIALQRILNKDYFLVVKMGVVPPSAPTEPIKELKQKTSDTNLTLTAVCVVARI